MDSDQRDILNFLQTWGVEFVSAKEICRRAGTKKRFHKDAGWAKPILLIMVEQGILETDQTGRYRIKPQPKKLRAGRWVSPDISKILKGNGVPIEINDVENIIEDLEQT
mgnify:FL=1|jgi:hypothetical protein